MKKLPLKVHYFQHVPFEKPAGVTEWLAAQGCEVSATRFYKPWQPPELDQVGLLIVMGGPMGVEDEETHPWLKAEKRLIEAAIEADIYILGICLGAQLVASVLGAPVTRNREKEIGWYPVTGVEAGGLLRGLPTEFSAFHWHGDTFALPAGSRHLFRSAACENQGFLLNDKILGLQFHLELDLPCIEGLIAHCREELVPGPYVQTEEALRGDSVLQVPSARQRLHVLLENFLQG